MVGRKLGMMRPADGHRRYPRPVRDAWCSSAADVSRSSRLRASDRTNVRASSRWLIVRRMNVSFVRTGARRYAVVVRVLGQADRVMDPAPGYDDDIPHDLVHYVVEAELGITQGVYGRAAQGGGTFAVREAPGLSARERARQRRKQQKRESSLRAVDDASAQQMATSERLAALCDVTWRRKHGQKPDPLRKAPAPTDVDDAEDIARVVQRLDAIAPQWRALPIGGALAFVWPGVEASDVLPSPMPASSSSGGSADTDSEL